MIDAYLTAILATLAAFGIALPIYLPCAWFFDRHPEWSLTDTERKARDEG